MPLRSVVMRGTALGDCPEARPAFDDGGALWLPLTAGKIGKLTPELLALSTDAGAPTTPAVVIASPDLAYADGMAFFPAAQGRRWPRRSRSGDGSRVSGYCDAKCPKS